MTKKTKLTLIAIIVVLIAGMALSPVIKRNFFGPGDDLIDSSTPVRTQRSALNVNGRIVKYDSLDDVFRTKGLLIPDEEVDLSFETSGKIENIYFREGAHVRKGELLAKVNDKPLQAELKKLETQVPLARDRVARQQALLQRDAVSQESYESVVTDHETLMADIELVKARIAQTELRAPFDGIVGLRQVSEGTYASPTTIVTKLTKITPLKIEFSVNESQAGDIRQGTPLKFTIDNDQNVYRASVYAVESRLDEYTLTLKARALYDNPGGRLMPGRSASIEINLHKFGNTIVVPSMSVITEMGQDIAYIYSNGTAKKVHVRKGMRTESAVQILDGINEGDTLITTGMMQLRDGSAVVLNNIEGAAVSGAE